MAKKSGKSWSLKFHCSQANLCYNRCSRAEETVNEWRNRTCRPCMWRVFWCWSSCTNMHAAGGGGHRNWAKGKMSTRNEKIRAMFLSGSIELCTTNPFHPVAAVVAAAAVHELGVRSTLGTSDVFFAFGWPRGGWTWHWLACEWQGTYLKLLLITLFQVRECAVIQHGLF